MIHVAPEIFTKVVIANVYRPSLTRSNFTERWCISGRFEVRRLARRTAVTKARLLASPGRAQLGRSLREDGPVPKDALFHLSVLRAAAVRCRKLLLRDRSVSSPVPPLPGSSLSSSWSAASSASCLRLPRASSSSRRRSPITASSSPPGPRCFLYIRAAMHARRHARGHTRAKARGTPPPPAPPSFAPRSLS